MDLEACGQSLPFEPRGKRRIHRSAVLRADERDAADAAYAGLVADLTGAVGALLRARPA